MSPQPERPSARAVERLAAGVGEDVADLRTRLHRALDEAERLQATGRDDLAVSVLEEQRDALLVVHQRLEARLADAAVEREAERAVAGTPALDASDPAPAAVDPAPVTADLAGDDGMALRLVASAVAAVLGVALLLSPELGSRGLTAAGSSAASDAPQDTASSRAGDAAREAGTTAQPATPDRDAGAAARGMDLSALALPEADTLPTRTRRDGDGSDPDPADVGELLPLPHIGPTIDSLSVTPSLPGPQDEPDAAESDGDDRAAQDGTAAEGDDTAGQGAGTDDTTSDEPAQDDGRPRSSQGGSADDDGGTEGSTHTDDGSTGGDQTDPSGGEQPADPGGEEPSGGGLDLGDTGGEPMSLEG